ncbi:MAG: NUDIX hydrolase [Hasllibacter sp.]
MNPARRDLRDFLARPSGPSSDFDLNPEVAAPVRDLRPAAVLVGVVRRDVDRVVLTRRSARLKHHPGQVAFPGGKLEPGEDAVAAALREAREEVGLTGAEVIGALPPHETVTGFRVTPVLARVPDAFAPVPEAGEVAEVFEPPLAYLTDPASFRVRRREWRGAWRRYYAVPWGPFYVWGATARILRGLAG